jgi:hypothetical protein
VTIEVEQLIGDVPGVDTDSALLIEGSEHDGDPKASFRGGNLGLWAGAIHTLTAVTENL